MSGKNKIQKLNLKEKKWYYKGEGNVNLVLSIPDDCVVLRIIKIQHDEINIPIIEAERELLLQTNFYQVVSSVFFHNQYVNVPELMLIENISIREINESVKHFRPKNRLHKIAGSKLVTVYPDYTLLLPKNAAVDKNYIVGSIYCAEIKPKQGWINEFERIGSKCVYCMNQYLKISQGSIDAISSYCPMDLFSGELMRMEKAVQSLLQTPQNNLKLFKDGEPIAVNKFGSIINIAFKNNNDFCTLIVLALVKELKNNVKHRYTIVTQPEDLNKLPTTVVEKSINNITFPGKSCNLSSINFLPQNCVLSYILSMQKLQSTSFSSIFTEYKQKLKELSDYYYIERLLSSITTCDKLCLDSFESYLIATTARDCSIYVTFCKVNPLMEDNEYVININDEFYLINVRVGDLDPKPLSCIQKHYKRNVNVLNACLNYFKCS
ncbi:inositol-pentakisphosphate 2-kinase-like isoform X1 [Adelges cooleyi]|uniref:inositol-pentakisphosphate 2-kinase-like isoform X1 n=1 Tax=Adelges cooleyi TaxID=133065 RepID=UPI0021807BDC|nr:inositol-pentakisphosphate 2-kinase-like isoform X1 [Adelges cooleyi]